jgi:hypothetical protein
MTYRDDREALQNRVRELEGELTDARKQGEEDGREAAEERAAELEKKLVELRGEMDKVGVELRELRGDKPKVAGTPAATGSGSGGRMLTLALVCAGLAGGAFLLLGRSPSEPSPRPVLTATAVPLPEVPNLPSEPPPPATVAKPVEPPPKAVLRQAHPRWRATVKRAEGVALAAGSPCVIEATVTTDATNAYVPELRVTCGTQALYSSEDPLNGMAQMDNDAVERLGPRDDQSTFTLQFSDIGTRTGARAQIDLDTALRQGVVFRETLPRYRVELSVPVESEPTAALAGPGQRLSRSAKVTDVSGSAPVKSGAACLVRAMPAGHQDACVAQVTCGTTVLFPASAPVRCTFDSLAGSRLTSVESPGGPLSLHVTEASAQVKSEGPKAFAVGLAFDQ